MYSAARRAGNEWLFLPKGFASFARRCPVKLAGYVHDIMGEYYHQHYRGYEPRLEYEYFARSLRAALRQARVLFTNSAFTRSELLGLAGRWGIAAPPVVVAGYGFDAESYEPPPKENTVLLFASKVPHKQTGLALRLLDRSTRPCWSSTCSQSIPWTAAKSSGQSSGISPAGPGA